MFGSAIQEAESAASTWYPEQEDPSGGRGCRPHCLHLCRRFVLDGPLRDLPHPVMHAAVLVVDEIVMEQVGDADDQLRWSIWVGLDPEQDADLRLQQRLRAAKGALMITAEEELSRAESRFVDQRARFIEPALGAHLTAPRPDVGPWLQDR